MELYEALFEVVNENVGKPLGELAEMKDTTLISNVFIVGLLIAPLFILLVSLCKSKPTHTSLDSLSKLGQSQPRRK